METQTLLNILAGIICGGLGWFSSQLWDAVKELKVDLARLRESLPKEYIAKEDFRDGINKIEIMLTKIMDKLDNKVDK